MEILIVIAGIVVLVACGVLRAFAGRDWKLDRGNSWGRSYREEWGFGNDQEND